MVSEKVSPLRISKTTPMSSPTKPTGQRPLSEINSTSQRRNSPSFNQATKKLVLNRESSPFDASPFKDSPRLFWKEKDPTSPGRFNAENSFTYERDSSLSPKRNSIENLKKASRVKNSNMFAREQKNEYDPAAVTPVERPLAAGRPLSTQVQGNAYGGLGLDGLRNETGDGRSHQRGNSQTRIPVLSPSKSPGKLPTTEYTTSSPPPRDQPSPMKSSLSNGRPSAVAKAYDPEASLWSEDDDTSKVSPARPLRRHAKSVTFDAAPPQINEYEMVTPDPSSVASGSREGSYDSFGEYDEDESFEGGSSMHDDSFDASLEDTDKTPVVLPEDWRHMSPEVANTSLADTFDDPFDGREASPMPSAHPNAAPRSPVRNESANSEGSRPLPALPRSVRESISGRGRRESAIGLASTAERLSSSQRSLPSPPPASSITKADILGMRDNSMSLEERLRLMELQGTPDPDMSYVSVEERSPQKTPRKKDNSEIQIHEDSVVGDDLASLPNLQAPRISRESILRKVQSRTFDDVVFDYDDNHSSPDRSYGDLADLDPDVPIPSREVSSNFEEQVQDMVIKQEFEEIDHYSIPDMYSPERSLSRVTDYEIEESVIRYDIVDEPSKEDDDGSVYSSQSNVLPEQKPTSNSGSDDEGPPTPKATLPGSPKSTVSDRMKHTSLPDFSGFSNTDFDAQLRGLMKGSPKPQIASLTESAPKLEAARAYLQRSVTPEGSQSEDASDHTDERSNTPDSVIRHSLHLERQEMESPVVPEPEATIKAPGGKLKTRPSVTPSDMASMAAARRQVSGEMPPPIPERSPRRSLGPEQLSEIAPVIEEDPLSRADSFRKIKLGLSLDDTAEDLSFDMDKEFDRVVEAQKKGYLMRQNTKIVVASNRQFSDEKAPMSPTGEARGSQSAGNSPRKASHERSKTWTTEPWNGKVRRKSSRLVSGGHKKAPLGPMPPLPGQESNVHGPMDTLMEDHLDPNLADECTDRGRFFVKVVGVKDLDLPLPKNERTQFQLTLDNGIHSVTTSWLELGRSAPINQEFELVVENDLEFQLTLQTKLEAPPKPQAPASPTKAPAHKKSASSTFSRLLASPKKRKEMERKQQEDLDRAAQQEQAAMRKRQPTAWDLLHDLVAPDGSFARAYVCLKNHEKQAYGRLLEVDIPCFNEWAVEDAVVASSARSKHGGVVRRPPYRIGKLELQLMFVPKPKNAKDEDMPNSINTCIRELAAAEELKSRSWEGHLSQQGGDCPYWRRRFFRLHGSKLTAYHETTGQPRATINLGKASKLIDDRTKLTEPSKTKTGGRRKSAFSEDEEGYMFVEEGFRIRFANGEVIDFYADNAAQKEGWMKVLADAVGTEAGGAARAWTDLILEKERKEKAAAKASHTVPHGPTSQMHKAKAIKDANEQQQQRRPNSANKAMPMPVAKSAPNSPQKQRFPVNPRDKGDLPPTPLDKSPRHESKVVPRTNVGRRQQVKSMLF